MKLDKNNGDRWGEVEDKCTDKDKQLFDVDLFGKRLSEAFKNPISAVDSKGHSEEVRFRLKPFSMDRIGELRELLPKKWFKSSAAFNRALFTVGYLTTLYYVQHFMSRNVQHEIDFVCEMIMMSRMERLKNHVSEAESMLQAAVRRGESAGNIAMLTKLRDRGLELMDQLPDIFESRQRVVM